MQEHYELMFIVPGACQEAEVPLIKDRVVAMLKKAQATITKEEALGRKKLAFKIKQELNGFYYLIELDLEKSALKELSHQLELMPEVLRFLITKAVVKTKEDLAEEETIKARIRARQAESVKQELKAAEQKAEDEKKVEFKKEEEITEGKLSMEDLDKKLDEILGDDLKV